VGWLKFLDAAAVIGSSYYNPENVTILMHYADEGNHSRGHFREGTCRHVSEAIGAAKKVGYENGIMIKDSEVSRIFSIVKRSLTCNVESDVQFIAVLSKHDMDNAIVLSRYLP
jgi:hypothetical protein